MLNNIAEVCSFVGEVLGKESEKQFEEKIEAYVCFVKMSALTNPEVSDSWMRTKLRKYASSIILASIKGYLDKKYSDDAGNLVLNVGFGKAYDKDLKPIPAINKVRDSQKTMVKHIVSLGMFEFEKGRDLAMSMISKANSADEPYQATIEQVKAEIKRIEKKLPDISKEEASKLLSLYQTMKEQG